MFRFLGTVMDTILVAALAIVLTIALFPLSVIGWLAYLVYRCIKRRPRKVLYIHEIRTL